MTARDHGRVRARGVRRGGAKGEGGGGKQGRGDGGGKGHEHEGVKRGVVWLGTRAASEAEGTHAGTPTGRLTPRCCRIHSEGAPGVPCRRLWDGGQTPGWGWRATPHAPRRPGVGLRAQPGFGKKRENLHAKGKKKPGLAPAPAPATTPDPRGQTYIELPNAQHDLAAPLMNSRTVGARAVCLARLGARTPPWHGGGGGGGGGGRGPTAHEGSACER